LFLGGFRVLSLGTVRGLGSWGFCGRFFSAGDGTLRERRFGGIFFEGGPGTNRVFWGWGFRKRAPPFFVVASFAPAGGGFARDFFRKSGFGALGGAVLSGFHFGGCPIYGFKHRAFSFSDSGRISRARETRPPRGARGGNGSSKGSFSRGFSWGVIPVLAKISPTRGGRVFGTSHFPGAPHHGGFRGFQWRAGRHRAVSVVSDSAAGCLSRHPMKTRNPRAVPGRPPPEGASRSAIFSNAPGSRGGPEGKRLKGGGTSRGPPAGRLGVLPFFRVRACAFSSFCFTHDFQ